jgi:hypothetical protein
MTKLLNVLIKYLNFKKLDILCKNISLIKKKKSKKSLYQSQ